MKQLSANAQALLIMAAILLFLCILGIVGRGDYEDALEEERFYTEMVCKGFWPDYKNLGVECEGINGADG
jgi:hypothetical protein